MDYESEQNAGHKSATESGEVPHPFAQFTSTNTASRRTDRLPALELSEGVIASSERNDGDETRHYGTVTSPQSCIGTVHGGAVGFSVDGVVL